MVLFTALQLVLNHPQRPGYLALVLPVSDTKLLAHLADWRLVDVMRTQQQPVILMDAADHDIFDNNCIKWVDDNGWPFVRAIVAPSSLDAAA